MLFSAWAACVSLLLPSAAVAQYNLVKEYVGESFFDDWSFYGNSECDQSAGSLSARTLSLRHPYYSRQPHQWRCQVRSCTPLRRGQRRLLLTSLSPTSSFLNSIDAFHNGIAFVNDAGNAIMKVDNSSRLKFSQKRDAIRISTRDQFTVGSVWVADILHVPYGVRRLPLLNTLAITPALTLKYPNTTSAPSGVRFGHLHPHGLLEAR